MNARLDLLVVPNASRCATSAVTCCARYSAECDVPPPLAGAAASAFEHLAIVMVRTVRHVAADAVKGAALSRQ